jgi:hypothetical protein
MNRKLSVIFNQHPDIGDACIFTATCQSGKVSTITLAGRFPVDVADAKEIAVATVNLVVKDHIDNCTACKDRLDEGPRRLN